MNRPIVPSTSDSSMLSDLTDPNALPFSDMDLDSDQDSRSSLHKQLEALADATLLVDHHCYPFVLPSPQHQASTPAHTNYVLPPLHTALTTTPQLYSNLSSFQAFSNTHQHQNLQHPRHTSAFTRALRDIHTLLAPLTPQTTHNPQSANHHHHHHHSLITPTNPTTTAPITAPTIVAPSSASPGTNTTNMNTRELEKRVDTIRFTLGPIILARRCFDAAGIGALIIDDSIQPPIGTSLASFHYFHTTLGIPIVRRILDIGHVVHEVLLEIKNSWNHHLNHPDDKSNDMNDHHHERVKQNGNHHSNNHHQHEHHHHPHEHHYHHFQQYNLVQRFQYGIRNRIDPLPQGVVAFKIGFVCNTTRSTNNSGADGGSEGASSGLDMISSHQNENDLNQLLVNILVDQNLSSSSSSSSPSSTSSTRTRTRATINLNIMNYDQRLLNMVIKICMEIARRHGIPVQFPCGIHQHSNNINNNTNDNNLNDTTTHSNIINPNIVENHLCNPFILQPIIEQYSDVHIILLRSIWPYTKESIYLASIYPHVYLDISIFLTPFMNIRGLSKLLDQILDIIPTNKLLYSSHGFSTDAFYLASKWGRNIIVSAMKNAVLSGDMNLTDAKIALKNILAENAIRLYNLPTNNDF